MNARILVDKILCQKGQVALPVAQRRDVDRADIEAEEEIGAEIAAFHLRRTLEHGYDATQAELFIDDAQLRALGKELGYL